MTKNKIQLLFSFIIALLLSCSPSLQIKSDEIISDVTVIDTVQPTVVCDTGQYRRDIDFADAFDTSVLIDGTTITKRSGNMQSITEGSVRSESRSTFYVPSRKVRIALQENVSSAVLYSVGNITISGKNLKIRGRILFSVKKTGGQLSISAGGKNVSVTMPCTLYSEYEYNYLEFSDATYRGAIIAVAGRNRGTLTIVNYLDVEDYLRGVVPLEIGKRSQEEIEALKAQAVAARTYTYRRMSERTGEPFDMVNTVADQVYGGASVEYREADVAVRATENLLMTYDDSIIIAYYHSTCGGATATIDEVWKKPPQPYLRSIADLNEKGEAWCRASTYFTWEETWPWKQFSSIVLQQLRKLHPQKKYKGVVNGISIDERFECGRIKRATITGSGWAEECGGDAIRFILRRGTSRYPILRSARFSVTSPNRSVIRISGKGYGHGVGMCQTGAIGRAQAGQDFRTILTSYYPGVSIDTVTTHLER